MRILSLAAFLILGFSANALAYPAFGDQVSFVGVSKSAKGIDSKMRVTWHITQFERYTPDLNSLPVLSTVTKDGKKKVTEKYLVISKMWSRAKVRAQLARCQERGGKLEAVQTLAGALKSCRIIVRGKTQQTTYWIADVPFGIARIEALSKSGRKTSLILEKVRRTPIRAFAEGERARIGGSQSVIE